MRKSNQARPNECPNCQKPDGVLPILWGMPNDDDDLTDVFVGGCIVPETRPWPKWHCEQCAFEWV